MRVLVFAALCACVMSEGTWRLIKKNIATIDIGISFIDPLVGYTAGTLNGAGPAIFKSTDGAVTWNQCNVTSFGLDFFLMDIDAAGQSVVVSSEAGEMYSIDAGKSWHFSLGGGLSQSVRHIGPNGSGGHKFGVTGNYGLRNVDGVAISTNSGRTFTTYDANLFTEARYGAFPSDNTWYVAAGEWPPPPPPPPSSNDDDPSVIPKIIRHGLARLSQLLTHDGRIVRQGPVDPTATPSPNPSTGGYSAQLSKSTNGGQNWTTVFAENGTFYFNGIDCNPTNEDHCCAVGEGFADPPVPSTQPGARIHCTRDGGKTWTRTFWQPEVANAAYSLMELRFSNATDIWAVGGIIKSTSTPWFVHSVDGGTTWTTQSPAGMLGAMAVGVSMVNPKVGYAVVLNAITQSSSVAKYEEL